MSKQRSTLLPNGNNVERVCRKISSFRQSRMLLRHRCRFWQQCRTKFLRFDKVNNERVQLVSTLSKESLDLWHSTIFLRHCCRCGRGFIGLLVRYYGADCVWGNALCTYRRFLCALRWETLHHVNKWRRVALRPPGGGIDRCALCSHFSNGVGRHHQRRGVRATTRAAAPSVESLSPTQTANTVIEFPFSNRKSTYLIFFLIVCFRSFFLLQPHAKRLAGGWMSPKWPGYVECDVKR